MPVRMRVTVKTTGDLVGELQIATNLRRELWAHSPVEVDPDHPLNGVHRDQDRRAYFEFATESPAQVRRAIEPYSDRVELTDTPALPGDECPNCGNVAGQDLPSICPNCGFRDISPCPICGEAISRQLYTRISGDLFRCPHCHKRVRLRFNSPMFLPNGDFSEPLVLVETEATAAHEI